MNFIRKLFFTPVVVKWESTDLNYTVNGPRETGEFTARTFVGAWFWGQMYTFFHGRAGVYIYPALKSVAATN